MGPNLHQLGRVFDISLELCRYEHMLQRQEQGRGSEIGSQAKQLQKHSSPISKGEVAFIPIVGDLLVTTGRAIRRVLSIENLGEVDQQRVG